MSAASRSARAPSARGAPEGAGSRRQGRRALRARGGDRPRASPSRAARQTAVVGRQAPSAGGPHGSTRRLLQPLQLAGAQHGDGRLVGTALGGAAHARAVRAHRARAAAEISRGRRQPASSARPRVQRAATTSGRLAAACAPPPPRPQARALALSPHRTVRRALCAVRPRRELLPVLWFDCHRECHPLTTPTLTPLRAALLRLLQLHVVVVVPAARAGWRAHAPATAARAQGRAASAHSMIAIGCPKTQKESQNSTLPARSFRCFCVQLVTEMSGTA